MKIIDVSLLADESVMICENGREVEVKGNGHYGGKGFYLRAGGKEGTEEECWTLYRVLKNSTMAEQEAYEGGEGGERKKRANQAKHKWDDLTSSEKSSYSSKPSSKQMHRAMIDVMEKSQINAGEDPQRASLRRGTARIAARAMMREAEGILAKKWYSKAISNYSDRTAQYELGKILLNEGTESQSKDDVKFEEGMGLIKLASRQGHLEAMVVLGRYAQEQGNFEEASGMFKAAAAKGSAEGSNELGMCYYGRADGKGIGVDQSFTDAFESYSTAATRGSAAGWCNLGMMYELGKGMLERDIGVALKCYENGAGGGNAKAMSCLGRLLIHTATVDAAFGTSISGGAKSDAFEKAIRWLRKAAELGDAAASYELGCVYLKGMGGWAGNVIVPVDLTGALSLFKMACRLCTEESKVSRKTSLRQHSSFPLGPASLMAADMLYGGEGVSGEEAPAFYKKEAYMYYKMASGTGNVQAMNSLGIMTEQEGDEFQAMELYVRGMKNKERCWAGYCAYNMTRMCEPYICNDLVLVPDDLAAGGLMEMKSQQDKVKLKRRSAAVRVRLTELLGESVKKEDLDFCLKFYKLSIELGCAKGGADVQRIETKLRRRDELAKLAELGERVASEEERVKVVGSGVGEEGRGGEEEEEVDATSALALAERLKSDGSAAKTNVNFKMPSSPGQRRRVIERSERSSSMVASPPEKRSGGVVATPSPRVLRQGSIGSVGSLLEGIKGESEASVERGGGGGGSEGGFMAGIYYKSPEQASGKKTAKVVEEAVPKAVLTDDEDSGGDSGAEEVVAATRRDGGKKKEEENLVEEVELEPGQLVIRKRYADPQVSGDRGGGGRGKGGEHGHHHNAHRHHHEVNQPPPGVEEIDKKQQERLPSPPQVAKAEDDWDDIKIGAASPPSSSGTGSSGSSEESFGEWFYVDKKGAQQGPFNGSIINDWTTAGYLPMDLKVKHGENSKIFKSLGEVWNQSFGIDKTYFEEDDEEGQEGGGVERKRGREGDKRVEDIDIGSEMTPIKRSNRNDRSF
ncbi:hypothetical protein TL16_g02236 [Triparma laevis f. inornata]|uniref:GYF domain-containing protein n=1 Tax=Triparma laevis f. inornata TaxID=1714386 RepID=A0A9W7DVV3_9STRA|nr:hypothetical protein TL16_g02236 [Triparma laevis f. inornata]